MAVPDAVARAGIGSDDLEMLSGIELLGLLRREPGPEEARAFRSTGAEAARARSAVATAIITQAKADSATKNSTYSCAQIIRHGAAV
jgi:hypothetical protein